MSNSPSVYGTTTVFLQGGRQEVIFSLSNHDDNPLRTVSVGYISQIGMRFNISEKSRLGISFGFQNDTEGAAITHIPISYYFTL